MASSDRRNIRLGALFLVASSLVLPMVSSPAAFAEGDGIEIVSESVTADFPMGVSFKLSATGPDPIEEIQVFFRAAGTDLNSYGYLDIEPGTQVGGEYVMNIGQAASHKPPGSIIFYSFEIRDTSGRELVTEEKEFLYMDTTVGCPATAVDCSPLEWQEVSDGLITVYYYGEFVEKRATTVLEAAKETIRIMSSVLGIEPQAPIRILSYNNYPDMSQALPYRSQAVRQDLETQGQAFVSERVLLVLGSGSTVRGIASHEFVHILVAEAAGRGYTAVPAWLNEGLAEFGNIDQTPAYDQALAYAVFTRRLKPLWYQGSFGGDADDIIIGYGQGKSVVEYMIETYGEEKMAELMSAFGRVMPVDLALMAVYGFDQYGLDSEWRESLGLEPFPPPDEFASQGDSIPTATPDAGGTPSPSPTAVAEVTPAQDSESSTQAPAVSDEGRVASRSCSRPSTDSGHLSLDVALLALLGGPLLALKVTSGLGKGQSGFGLNSIRRRKQARHRSGDIEVG